MITDRISLNIALKYLNQFEQNQGKVVDVLFSYRNNANPGLKSAPAFQDLDVLRAFIAKYAPIQSIEHADCSPLLLFELKKFTILKNGTDKNLVYFDDTNFVSKSQNIDQFSIESLNRDYLSAMTEVRSAFNDVLLDEYILNQLDYIECGWLEMHTEVSMEQLTKLYNKYK
jgi:hypothetical protein